MTDLKFSNLLNIVNSSDLYDKLQRYSSPLSYCLGINHFWYYRITDSGNYSYFGTHSDWSEYCFEHELTKQFPVLRHPRVQRSGLSLMRTNSGSDFAVAQDQAWKKYGIHFCLNISKRTSEGIEAFGFGTCVRHQKIEEQLLNELPLLERFVHGLRIEHPKLFEHVHKHEVDISDYMGPNFYKTEELLLSHENVTQFVQLMGWLPKTPLTLREKEILRLVVNGFPASHIGKQLHISVRTVENHLATLKCKLYCDSKVELIKKAKELLTLRLLDT